MRMKLTPAFVAKPPLPEPPKDRAIHWDGSLPGFGLMVTANGHAVIDNLLTGHERNIEEVRASVDFQRADIRSYAQIAFAYTRSLDDESAITTLEKALEIEPDNGTLRGQLEQLKSYRRKK